MTDELARRNTVDAVSPTFVRAPEVEDRLLVLTPDGSLAACR